MGNLVSRVTGQRTRLGYRNGNFIHFFNIIIPIFPLFQESMSSTELSGQTRASSCTFCVDDYHGGSSHATSSDAKRLETLCVDVARLQNEKHDLLRQNVSCKTDIKKLKDRWVIGNRIGGFGGIDIFGRGSHHENYSNPNNWGSRYFSESSEWAESEYTSPEGRKQLQQLFRLQKIKNSC